MSPWIEHLPVLPILVPLLAGSVLLLLKEGWRVERITVSICAAVVQAAVALLLLYLTSEWRTDIWPEGIGAYAIGNWSAPFGIVLVVDRLSALMIALNTTLAVPVIVYSTAQWDRMGIHYHALVQFLLMGVNGAFLTGDLFNLFVFIEVLLAASYALLVHGGGRQRVQMALHFIVVNLVASFALLIGIAMIYGVMGTLNLADIAARYPQLSASDRHLTNIAAAIFGIAFLVKAGCWPLNFWLPGTYAAAGAPVAAIFTITTKVGVYAILRVALLLEEPVTPFGGTWLFYGALITMAFGIAGMLAARQLPRLVSFAVILSSGTLLAAVGLGVPEMLAPALFYLVCSVLATAMFFMLSGMTERMRTAPPVGANMGPVPPPTYTAFGLGESADPRAADNEVGIAIPAAMAFLGLLFVCCTLLVTGMPPLAGFVAKLSLLTTALHALSSGHAVLPGWLLIGMLLAAGFGGLIALSRLGMRLFWSPTGRTTPRLRLIEVAPVVFLGVLTIALTVCAGPAMMYLDSTARMLHERQTYIRVVLSGEGLPSP
jgi:multicomponent K+:H+ antiporter subunit D